MAQAFDKLFRMILFQQFILSNELKSLHMNVRRPFLTKVVPFDSFHCNQGKLNAQYNLHANVSQAS